MYENVKYGFNVSYPIEYLLGQERGADFFTLYVTREQKSPFRLKYAPTLYIEKGEQGAYIRSIAKREDSAVISRRNVTVGASIDGEQIASRPTDTKGGAKLVETVFSNGDDAYVIWQRYDERIDPAYPMLIQTFSFQ